MAPQANTPNTPEQGLLPPSDLKCENRIRPLNIDTPRPRMGWLLHSFVRGCKQSAYQVLVASSRFMLDQEQGDLWDSGRVSSNDSTWVEYAGRTLESGMTCHWKLRSWDDHDQASPWSEEATWTMGMLDIEDWQATWIGAGWTGDWRENNAPPLPWLRRTFDLNIIHARAIAHVSSALVKVAFFC